jgi:ribosomal protein S3
LQMSKPYRSRHWSFRFGLLFGIANMASRLFKEAKKNGFLLSGFKVVCGGKWNKTRSGRKQMLLFSIGKLRTPSMNYMSTYGATSLATKFGTFGIKVWISYKPFRAHSTRKLWPFLA